MPGFVSIVLKWDEFEKSESSNHNSDEAYLELDHLGQGVIVEAIDVVEDVAHGENGGESGQRSDGKCQDNYALG